MNYKLVPTLLTEPMSEVLRNEHCVYQIEQELYNALLEAAPDVPVEFEPVGEIDNLGPARYCVKFVTNPPAFGTKLYALPPDAAAVIAAKDAEIERLKEERLGGISQSKMHPSWLEKTREEILDCLRFQGRTTAVLLVETADLRKQLAAAEKQRDVLFAALKEIEFALAMRVKTVRGKKGKPLTEIASEAIDAVTTRPCSKQ